MERSRAEVGLFLNALPHASPEMEQDLHIPSSDHQALLDGMKSGTQKYSTGKLRRAPLFRAPFPRQLRYRRSCCKESTLNDMKPQTMAMAWVFGSRHGARIHVRPARQAEDPNSRKFAATISAARWPTPFCREDLCQDARFSHHALALGQRISDARWREARVRFDQGPRAGPDIRPSPRFERQIVLE